MLLDIPCEADGAMELAKRSRGTPRIANRLLKRVRDFAEIMGIEFIHINKDTKITSFKKELFYNDVAYKLGM